MSYNVKTLAVFEKQAKRLIKKYPSLKIELSQLIIEPKEKPGQGISIGKIALKSEFPSHQKVKKNRAGYY